MSIVNCRVKYIRPEYNNLKEWMEDDKNVYIGRAGIVFIDGKRFPQRPSDFANPFKIGKKDGTREEVTAKYKEYMIERLDTEEGVFAELRKLKGKNLGCWCHPEPCHGNVLLELIKINF